jgi:hypothetical protein
VLVETRLGPAGHGDGEVLPEPQLCAQQVGDRVQPAVA